MPTAAALLRTLAILLVALMAPRRMLARVGGLDWVGLMLLVCDLERMHARGELLRYPGESLATVAARLDLLVWISDAPHRALRHLARRARGHRRHTHLARVAPPSFAPPRQGRVVLARGWIPLAAAPDT